LKAFREKFIGLRVVDSVYPRRGVHGLFRARHALPNAPGRKRRV
jgi:hypothetical protein